MKWVLMMPDTDIQPRAISVPTTVSAASGLDASQ
jgi:hypothetical protein